MTEAFTPSILTLTVAPDSAPAPLITTASSSAAFTTPSPAIGVLIVTAVGAVLSRVIEVVAATEVLPALSVCVADTVNVPLFNALISNSLPLSVQLPLASAVVAALTPLILTLTVAFASAPAPIISTVSSSLALTISSPSIGVLIVKLAGALLSNSKVRLLLFKLLFAGSVAVKVTAIALPSCILPLLLSAEVVML